MENGTPLADLISKKLLAEIIVVCHSIESCGRQIEILKKWNSTTNFLSLKLLELSNPLVEPLGICGATEQV